MNKTMPFFIMIAAATILAGCSAQKTDLGENKKFSAVFEAASYCTDQVYAAANGRTGRMTRTSIFWHKGQYLRVGDFAMSEGVYRAIPVMEASAVDNGEPSSFWRHCMSQKGIHIVPQ
jgi:hypothetical protein